MTADGSRVAVVVPVRDGAGEVEELLDCLERQTRPPDELVVVDNGSTDGTGDLVRRRGVEVVEETRPGSYAARNAGVAATTADIIAFTDADCLPEPGWLEHLVPVFDDPDVGVAGGEVVPVGGESLAHDWAIRRGVLVQARAVDNEYRPFVATANAAFRRSTLDAIGGFDADLFSGGDVDACWRAQLLAGCRVILVPDAVVRHRHRIGVRGLLRQEHRYAVGHGRLDTRWSWDPAYRRAQGRAGQRMRAVWLLPLRLIVWALRRDDPRIPLLDAAVRVSHEIGRRRGRRRPLAPLPAGVPEGGPGRG